MWYLLETPLEKERGHPRLCIAKFAVKTTSVMLSYTAGGNNYFSSKDKSF